MSDVPQHAAEGLLSAPKPSVAAPPPGDDTELLPSQLDMLRPFRRSRVIKAGFLSVQRGGKDGDTDGDGDVGADAAAWVRRWVVLRGSVLEAYRTPSDSTPAVTIDLTQCAVVEAEVDVRVIQLRHSTSGGGHRFQADGASDALQWTAALRRAAGDVPPRGAPADAAALPPRLPHPAAHPECAVCGTKHTPKWRRFVDDNQNVRVACNACGLLLHESRAARSAAPTVGAPLGESAIACTRIT